MHKWIFIKLSSQKNEKFEFSETLNFLKQFFNRDITIYLK